MLQDRSYTVVALSAPAMAVPAVPAVRWGWVAALLAGYGFLKEVRPSEPYITPFLTGPDKNFTEEQVRRCGASCLPG